MNITKSDLSLNELMILNSEMREAEKSLGLGYLMLMGGHLGIHRFYLKRYKSAIIQLVLFLTSTVSYFLFYLFFGINFEEIGIFFLVLMILTGGILFVWIIIDLFRLPRMTKEWNDRIEQDILEQIVRYRRQEVMDVQ